MKDLLEEQRVLPNIIKVKKGIPTVIEWNGQRYVLDNEYKPEFKKPLKNTKLTLK